ncbi:MAG: hypothetical protein HY784_00595 [Chloroflexi bacterium]|nr:hypothetical protein [Chloroflexota bacterium]
MQFSSNNTTVATVNPGSDPAVPYTTQALCAAGGSATISARGIMNGAPVCSDTSILTCAALTPAPTPTPTPGLVSVSGTVYEGTGTAFNKCIGIGETTKPGGGSKVSVNPDNQWAPVQGNGTYSVSQISESGVKTIAISGMDAGYQCSCPSGCQYTGADISGGNNTDWDFYVSNLLTKWWQALGGGIHAQTAPTVVVPAGRYLIAAESGGSTVPSATKLSGSYTTSPGALSADPGREFTDAIDASTWKYGYQFLWKRAGRPAADPGNGFFPPSAGQAYLKSGNYTIRGGAGWTNLSGWRVIFVNGDVTINGDIGLQGIADFFAVITSGNITVDQSVGDNAVANPTAGQADLARAYLVRSPHPVLGALVDFLNPRPENRNHGSQSPDFSHV